jgi:hemerythrin
MALFEWKESFSVSVVKFDNQHKKLISLINELHTAMSEGKGKEVLGKVFAELIDYTKTHFADEEAEFKKYAYPEYATHRSEHEKLTKEVITYYNDFMAGKTSLSIDVLTFLRNWLQKHIMGTDKRYSRYLASKEIK